MQCNWALDENVINNNAVFPSACFIGHIPRFIETFRCVTDKERVTVPGNSAYSSIRATNGIHLHDSLFPLSRLGVFHAAHDTQVKITAETV